MIRKLGYFLLCAASIFSANVFSATIHESMMTGAAEYILLPDEPQILSNVFMWNINAICKIVSENELNPFSFKILRKTGSFNGRPLKSGDLVEVVLHANEKIYFTAAPGAKVELVNRGEVKVIAECSAA
jgi:hypothetical protein